MPQKLTIIWDVRLWIAAALTFAALALGEPLSPFWFSAPLLIVLMVGLYWAQPHFPGTNDLRLRTRIALYALAAWALGMVYECSLTTDGTGIGGIHPDTYSSFVLAQGDYIPLALVFAFIVCRWQLDFKQAFYLAAGASLTEGLVFGPSISSAWTSGDYIGVMLLIAHLAVAYASFLATPALLFGFLQTKPKTIRHRRILSLLGVGFLVALVVRIIWGMIYAPLAVRIFALKEPLI